MNPPIEALQLLLMASSCVKSTLRYRSHCIVTRQLKHKVLQWSKLKVVHHLPQGLHSEWNTRARVKFSPARKVTRVSASTRVVIFTLSRALPLPYCHWETTGAIWSLTSSLAANLFDLTFYDPTRYFEIINETLQNSFFYHRMGGEFSNPYLMQ